MATDLDKLYEIANGSKAAQKAAPGAAVQQGAIPRAAAQQTMNPAGITQSFYTNPTTYQNYETSQRPGYQQSAAVQDAGALVQQQLDDKPGAYQSQYDQSIQNLIAQAMETPDFSYDFSQDPAYGRYAERYQQGGQEALEKALQETEQLTGGYGNSYGEKVGAQTYQNYLQEMNMALPTLREQAAQEYMAEANRMLDNIGMLQTEDDRQYGMHRDTVNDWRTDLNFMYTQFRSMSDMEYQRYMNDSAAWEADRAYWYQKAYDEQQQENWEKEFNAKYGSRGGRGGGGGGDDIIAVSNGAGGVIYTTVEQKDRGDRENAAWRNR